MTGGDDASMPPPPPRAFVTPVKRLHGPAELATWQGCASRADVASFAAVLGASSRGVPLTVDVDTSPVVAALVELLRTLERWVDEIPPVKQAMRFGNTAFRTWHARLVTEAFELLRHVLPPPLHGAVVELGPYLCDAFGNPHRIDYGTGHELAFLLLLLCLARVGALKPPDRPAVVTRAFAAYLRVTRKLQRTYFLEPAGSHGCWGLDDYQFLPFYWGASQLDGHPHLKPSCIHDDRVLADEAGSWLYLDAVSFVRTVKSGALRETSPMLSDISAMPSWARVAAGMGRMFDAEVLGKLPIAQHFLFGSLVPWPTSEQQKASKEAREVKEAAAAQGGGDAVEGAAAAAGQGPHAAAAV